MRDTARLHFAKDLGIVVWAKAIDDQAKGVTTFVEVILNDELGEPFRRDVMKKPIAVAGIERTDMRQQQRA